jgi:V8-like Glu-specific endopeptidase
MMNVSTTNDIIGGNSGSPLLNADGDITGLVFDGNLASLGGRYVYEADVNRTVAVHADAILAALQHVYGGTRVLAEIEASRRR